MDKKKEINKKILYGVIALVVIIIAVVFLLAKEKEKMTGMVVTDLGNPTGNTPVSAVHGEQVTAGNAWSITYNGCGAQQSGTALIITASKNTPSCSVVYQNSDFSITTIGVTASDNACTPSDSCGPATEDLMDADDPGVDFVTMDPPEDPQDEKA